ncbi:MAG: hypothetical protein DDT25_01226 [Chloroflexi bacterium]|nr:hypothetical protein [Chloroflexota bacterium]
MELKELKCLRCGHQWWPRPPLDKPPVRCPVCQSAAWQIPRKPKGG